MDSSTRSIRQVLETVDVQMGALTIGQPLPSPKVKQISPFLLLHHLGPLQVTPGVNPMEIGAHPHRGFAPVTFVFSGAVAHEDSLGNKRVVKAGGVQWMSAGSGIIHSEFADNEFVKQGGALEIIQLWINLPAALKMTAPTYQPFDQAEIPRYEDPHQEIQINVVCGEFNGLKGPVQHPQPLTAYTISLKEGSKITIPSNPQWHLLIYQLAGATGINQSEIRGRQLVDFNFNGEIIELQAIENSRLLLVSAQPIGEPLAQYGPFVMNRPEELRQAMDDYQSGEMGVL